MPGGSRKPILTATEGRRAEKDLPVYNPPLLMQRDGTEATPLEILLSAGSFKIAAERCRLSEAEFANALASEDPNKLAQGLKGIQLKSIALAVEKIGDQLLARIEDLKPGELARLYPVLMQLLPEISASRVSVAMSFNKTDINMDASGGAKLPPQVMEALQKLGLSPEELGLEEEPVEPTTTLPRAVEARVLEG